MSKFIEDRWLKVAFVLSGTLLFLCFKCSMSMQNNVYVGSYTFFLLSTFGGTIAILCLSMLAEHLLSAVEYWGKYSLVVLCFHNFVLIPAGKELALFVNVPTVWAIATFVVVYVAFIAIIPLVKRFCPAFIIKRLPVRLAYDNNYFNDKYQGIRVGGYNRLVDGLLDGVECFTSTDFFMPICPLTGKTYQSSWRRLTQRLVYTGALDEYFDFRLGRLDWRTVEFKTRIENTPNYQGIAVVNYTSLDKPYTSVIEHKHFEMFGQQVYDIPVSVVSEEYSTEYKEGMEPHYPVNDVRNNALADEYRRLAKDEAGVIFGGGAWDSTSITTWHRL